MLVIGLSTKFLRKGEAQNEHLISSRSLLKTTPLMGQGNNSPDMAMVVPATIPMVTPLGREGGRAGAYMAAGIPLGWTTVV